MRYRSAFESASREKLEASAHGPGVFRDCQVAIMNAFQEVKESPPRVCRSVGPVAERPAGEARNPVNIPRVRSYNSVSALYIRSASDGSAI